MKLRSRITRGFIIVAVIGWVIGLVGVLSMQWLTSLSGRQSTITQSYMDAAAVMQAHHMWRHGLTLAVAEGEIFEG